VVVRLLILMKKRLLWKIRNRLIFSGLFFIVTPIVFILIFFYFIIIIILAHYGIVVTENVMHKQVERVNVIVDQYLALDNETLMVRESSRLEGFNPPLFNLVLYKKKGDSYTPFFIYPKTLEIKKLRVFSFKGYFMINDKLYLGIMKVNQEYAVLAAQTINQEFMNELATINEFKIQYRNPRTSSIKKEVATLTAQTNFDDQSMNFPWLFQYKYLDFNTLEGDRPIERPSSFLLLFDFDKIYQKIRRTSSTSVQDFTRSVILVLIIIFGIFIIISFIIGLRMVRVLTQSINAITKGIQKVRRGDFSVRIKIKSRDQMQYLAESFNEMASGIDRLLVEEKEKQRLEEQLRIARGIQLKLLPPETFKSDQFEIEAINIPAAEIAGDYFDYFYQPEAYLSVLVADVSGKGASAAFYMAELKGLINYLQKRGLSPADLISKCNLSLNASFDKATFITISMAKFIGAEKKFIFSRAGHTQGIFYSSQKEECLELMPEGMAIGLKNFDKSKIEEISIPYQSGDILFLFSDGLSEIMNNKDEILGTEPLKQIIQDHHPLPLQDIKQKIIDYSIQFSGNQPNKDDLTFIIVRIL
jgi:serine phosphatase RsbU (regulator of sigma subunit)